MATALATTARNPRQCFDSFISLVGRLHEQFGVTIIYMSLGDKLGTWDGPTCTILIDRDASLEDQTWFLNQVWQLGIIGTSAIDAAAIREPRLALVPPVQMPLSDLA